MAEGIDPIPVTLATVSDMSETDKVIKYCLENHINKDVIDEVILRGYTSMAAFKLMDISDLQSPKIPKGQRRLLLHISQALSKDASPSTEQDTVAQVQSSGQAPSALFTGNSQPTQGSLYDQTLLNTMVSHQQQLSQSMGTSQRTDLPAAIGGLSLGAIPVTQPAWNDPQIHIASATGKSVSPYYDICDFVPSTMEEEVIIGGNGEQNIVVKSGPKKPHLENITLSQWSVANMAILYKLLGEGKLQGTALLDYLSHTTKIYQFIQRYSVPSVFQYDRECRKLQAAMGFRWGTDVQHLHKLHLIPREKVNTGTAIVGRKQPITGKPKGEMREAGICRNFNSKKGCIYPACRFRRQCILPGCNLPHAATTHVSEKN